MPKVRISEDDIIGLPRTLKEVKKMEPFEFQNWVCQKPMARASRKKVGDMGIDGWIMGTIPLQVKQSERVGRNVIDNFETAMRKKKKHKGIIFALSFTKGAYEEVGQSQTRKWC
ncbi:MAG: restriction endonuclease [Thermoplasmata archaeon]|nr:restriction endonuclease [Thermoplasmata archaeon]